MVNLFFSSSSANTATSNTHNSFIMNQYLQEQDRSHKSCHTSDGDHVHSMMVSSPPAPLVSLSFLPRLEEMKDNLSVVLTNAESVATTGPVLSSSDHMGLFSLNMSMALCEPTPINPNGTIFVADQVPLATAPWHNDDHFMDSLKHLMAETSSGSAILTSTAWSISAKLEDISRSALSMMELKRLKRSTTDESPKSASKNSVPLKKRRTTAPSKSNWIADIAASDDVSVCSADLSLSGIRNSHVEQWNQRHRELVIFRKEFHHCLVPLHWPRNPSLAHWVKRQRYQFRIMKEGRHSTMTEERQVALQKLGFVWDSHAAGWEERLNELSDFKEEYGHTNVPKKYPNNIQLAVWVKCQRRQHKLHTEMKSSNMTKGRIERLQHLGFVFNPRTMKRKFSFY